MTSLVTALRLQHPFVTRKRIHSGMIESVTWFELLFWAAMLSCLGGLGDVVGGWLLDRKIKRMGSGEGEPRDD